MPFTPTPKQTLTLWWLLSVEGGAFAHEIKPVLNAKDRRNLEQAGLLRVEKRTRQSLEATRPSQLIYVELTELGWMWATNNLDAEISTRSPASASILRRLLAKLKTHLTNTNGSLAEFIAGSTTMHGIATPPDEHSVATTSDVSQIETSTREIREACLRQTQGQIGVRVHLADIRRALPTIPREHFDQALHFMESNGWLVLYPLDNSREIQAEDQAAALPNSAGQPRHIIYLKKASA